MKLSKPWHGAVAMLAVLATLAGGSLLAKQLIFSGAATTTAAERAGLLQAQAKANQHRGVVPFLGPLKKGQCGNSVLLLDGALKKVHVRRDVARLCYGPGTEAQVKRFQRELHYKPTGVYNLATHQALVKRRAYSTQAIAKLIAIQNQRGLEELHAIRTKAVLTVTTHAYLVGRLPSHFPYTQSGARQVFRPWPLLPRDTDCSGFATWVAWQSGFGPAVGYFGLGSTVGYTGTLAVQGHVVPPGAPLKIGDFVLYGSGFPWGHVAVYIGRGLVISHGSPGLVEVPWNFLFGYRGLQVRRYF